MRPHILKRWALIMLAWGIFAATQTTFLFKMRRLWNKPAPWLQIARMSFAQYFLIWGIIMTPFTLWVCGRYPIERQNWRRRAVLHLVVSVLVSMGISLLRLPLHHFVYPGSDETAGWMMFRGYFFSNGFDDITMYWFVAFMCHAWMYYTRLKDHEINTSRLEAMLTRSQLQVLKMQLHPHFLFNALHSISELMHQDVSAADQMISRLSDLLRMTLETNGVQEVPLRRELEFLSGYVAIEQTRFRDRLRIVYEIDAETLDAHVPNMLLQPLVENSIRHGIAQHSGAGLVELLSNRTNGKLCLVLRNTLPEPGRAKGLPGFGVGLKNTRERLQQLYGSSQSFALRQTETGVAEVEIRIPFSTEPRSASDVLLTNSNEGRQITQVGS